MQVEYIDIIEGCHQTLTHTTKGRIVQVAVVGNKRENAMARLFNTPLGKTDEFNVVVVKSFRIALTQRLAIYFKIIFSFSISDGVKTAHQFLHPLSLIGRVAGIRRIP